jgi:hypothetical protein
VTFSLVAGCSQRKKRDTTRALVSERSDYRFEWDEKKNRQNIKKHGFDFTDVEEMFCGILLFSPDLREDYGESRWIGIGTIRGRTCRTCTGDHSHHLAKEGNPS